MSFTAINLERLPAPQIIEQPEFETIFEARKARLIELAPDLAPVLEYESDPLVQLLQEDSYRELLLRAAVQDAGKGNLLAYAPGAVLDHLAAFYGVSRLVIQEADATASPPLEEVLEDDERLRARVQLAPEGFTTAGSIGSYTFWALSASADVKDVAILETDTPVEVRIVVLGADGSGVADADLLALVDETTQPRRPLTDHVMVEAARVVTFEVEATLTLYEGPDSALVLQAARDAVEVFVAEHHRLGHDITVSGLHAALHQAGVQNVRLTQPTENLVIPEDTAAYCTAITVHMGGRDV
ncbi:Phage-related baseplate assembly protein [Candidatus Rhodobacter oscarellae]|uniref:Phage-related baseplate assembly protein n=1 Tax=Candidatus Rhodobacter oscarellae TaxID=1675527 RepID=A0A0J9H5C3_9RHOB|nr:baseplate J/gp47 family protein [Candidatus Rhodobacter lobularis]KMW60788.1 Phage-related baseplate assembly protein [Candidatus Rhodobacter lobularis]